MACNNISELGWESNGMLTSKVKIIDKDHQGLWVQPLSSSVCEGCICGSVSGCSRVAKLFSRKPKAFYISLNNADQYLLNQHLLVSMSASTMNYMLCFLLGVPLLSLLTVGFLSQVFALSVLPTVSICFLSASSSFFLVRNRLKDFYHKKLPETITVLSIL